MQGHQRHIEYVFEIALDPEQAQRVAVSSLELSGVAWYAGDALPRLQPEAREALERARQPNPGR